MAPRKTKKEIVDKLMPPARRDFTPQEVLELNDMQRLVNARKWEAAQIGGNTALIPRGQEVAKEVDAIARLLDNVKNNWVSHKLLECGYAVDTKCSINLSTGAIIIENEPADNPKI